MTRYENFLSEAKKTRETATMETLSIENTALKIRLEAAENALEAAEIRVNWLESENKYLRELLSSKNVSK